MVKSSCFAWPIPFSKDYAIDDTPIPTHSHIILQWVSRAHPCRIAEVSSSPLPAFLWQHRAGKLGLRPRHRGSWRGRQRRQRRLGLGSRRFHLSLLGPESTVNGLGFARFGSRFGKNPRSGLDWGNWRRKLLCWVGRLVFLLMFPCNKPTTEDIQGLKIYEDMKMETHRSLRPKRRTCTTWLRHQEK